MELHSQTDYIPFIRRNIAKGSIVQTNGMNIYAKVPEGYQLTVINKKSGSKMLPPVEDVVNEISYADCSALVKAPVPCKACIAFCRMLLQVESTQ